MYRNILFGWNRSNRKETVALPSCKPHIFRCLRKSHRYPQKLITLGDHIKARRLDLGYEQKDAANILKVSETSIMRWENNYNQPEMQNYPAIMNFLGYCPYVRPKNWGEKLKFHRIYRGLTIKQVGKIIKTDPTAIARWEKRNDPPNKNFYRRKAVWFMNTYPTSNLSIQQRRLR